MEVHFVHKGVKVKRIPSTVVPFTLPPNHHLLPRSAIPLAKILFKMTLSHKIWSAVKNGPLDLFSR